VPLSASEGRREWFYGRVGDRNPPGAPVNTRHRQSVSHLPAGQRSSIAFMISSAHRTASAIALTVAGTFFPPSNCASLRAARILAAINSTRLRPSSTRTSLSCSLFVRLWRLSERPQVRNHRCEISALIAKPLRDMVARDGVEPPTPAFSGLHTTSVSPLSFNNLTLQSGPSFVTIL